MDDERIQESALPGALREVAHIVGGEAGIAAAIAIAKGLGGHKMRVPVAPGPDHRLTRLLGAKVAALIGAHFAGDTITWPSARPFLRWHEARRLVGVEGWTKPQVARHLGISESQVRKLTADLHPAGEQDDDAAIERPAACPYCHRGWRRARPRHAPDCRQLTLFADV